MSQGKSIGIEKRSEIITFHEKGYSIRQISRRVGIPKSTVKDVFIYHFERVETLEDGNRSRLLRSTSYAEDQYILLTENASFLIKLIF